MDLFFSIRDNVKKMIFIYDDLLNERIAKDFYNELRLMERLEEVDVVGVQAVS